MLIRYPYSELRFDMANRGMTGDFEGFIKEALCDDRDDYYYDIVTINPKIYEASPEELAIIQGHDEAGDYPEDYVVFKAYSQEDEAFIMEVRP